jgi:hypothetical protein
MNKLTIRTLFVSLLAMAFAFGQVTTSSTTLSSAIDGRQNAFNVASATGITAPSFAAGNAPNGANQTILTVDQERMFVNAISGTFVSVSRGWDGTTAMAHVSGATVYSGPPTYFGAAGQWPVGGACTATSELNLPKINSMSGYVLNCIGGIWVIQNTPLPYNLTDGEFDIPISDCAPSVSDHAGTLGITVTGASNVYAMQAATSSSATTNTLTFTCPIRVPFRTNSGKGISITSVTADYGVQTTALGTQVNTLASGTYNGSIVFSKIVLPAPGASETPSTVTPVRADTGTLVATPVIASANVAITTAGSFYTILFTPAASFQLADLTRYLFTLSLQGGATPGTATVVNLLGVHVKYVNVPL